MRATARLWAGTVLFLAVLPATVLVYVPYWLTGWKLGPPLFGFAPGRWLGALLILAGLPVFVDFLRRFVDEGRGTPAPVAPPRDLVVTGGFRYVRNPGYVAVIALLSGQALLFGSRSMLYLLAGTGLVLHFWVLVYEEPTLRRKFGSAYADYCARVPRWIPRRPAPDTGSSPEREP